MSYGTSLYDKINFFYIVTNFNGLGGIRMVSKNFKKCLTFLDLGTNEVKVSSVNSELLFQSDTLQYSVSLVWVNPNQTRTSTMEDVVEKLATCPSSGIDWSYTLAQLYEGSHHLPLPKDKHLGILSQGKAEETSCGWISQLDICQLLPTSSQVVYLSGLNGHDEHIITTLPELLSSGISIIASEHSYLKIDIPAKEDSDAKALPIGEASIIQTTNPLKSPPKLEGSMTAEVNHLLDRAIMEESSCESEHSSLGKITTAVVTMSPPWKSEVSVLPVDTSSQANIKEAEGSLEDIPTNISPIAAVYSSRSVSSPVDPPELQANANRASDNMLHLKRSLDIKKQRATWELGVFCIRTNLRRPHQLLQPRSSIPSQSWRPKPISEWWSWRPRQPGAIQFKQLRQPVSKPSVKPKPGKLPRL